MSDYPKTYSKRQINFLDDVYKYIAIQSQIVKDSVVLDFEPTPLLPTYTFFHNNQEYKFALKRKKTIPPPHPLDNVWYLELIDKKKHNLL
jgi:hypothetical protein